MGKKNHKKLCWNCDGSVGVHLNQCPYCGIDLTKKSDSLERSSFSFQEPAPSTFSSSENPLGHPFQRAYQEEAIPKSPYGNLSVTQEEWNQALEGDSASQKNEEEGSSSHTDKNGMIALLLLLPGVVFFLFGLILILFSNNGVLTLQWNQSFAYFYFLGALPLLILGWKALS